MKKLLLTVCLAGFALVLQAGNDKAAAEKTASSCCSGAAMTADAKGQCPMAKQAKATCPFMSKLSKDTAGKTALQSPKAQVDARR